MDKSRLSRTGEGHVDLAMNDRFRGSLGTVAAIRFGPVNRVVHRQ
jgi:hypothetical protein